MPTLDFERTRKLLDAFDWTTLFVEELGWLRPADTRPLQLEAQGKTYTLRQAAHLGGVVALEVEAPDGRIPDVKLREALHRAVESHYHEHLLLFVDGERQQTIWSYTKYDGRKLRVRSHHFVRNQPPDLFLSKIVGVTFDLSELDEAGNASLLDVTRRLRDALDVEGVTKKFYAAFKEQQEALATEHVKNVTGERTRRHYASVLLTRLMFVYFLQKKGFLDDGDTRYLESRWEAHREAAQGNLNVSTFYRRFLRPLFFEGFARREAARSAETNVLLGHVRYLNGGLFLEHPIEEQHPDLDVDDAAIEGILGVFGSFSWHLDDTPGGKADEINPDVLGYILEKYVNQKAFGAYYTPPEITGYLCDATLDRFLLDEINDDPKAAAVLGVAPRRFRMLPDLLTRLDDGLARDLLAALQKITVLDPACGSGAFLVAALKKLLTVYRAVLGHAQLSKDGNLQRWLAEARAHPSTGYFLKKEIITRNLFGVDLMEEATEIAKLRLFLALVASAEKESDLEPLPNIDFNLLPGNALIGLLDVGHAAFGDNLFARQEFEKELADKNREVDLYRGTAQTLDRHDETGTLLRIRDDILRLRAKAQHTLDQILTDEFVRLKIAVQEAAWDGKKERYAKRRIRCDDVSALKPFHWAYEFSRVLERGGFDVIVTNPPWDILKPNDKEFFERHSDTVSKNNMRIEDFLKHKAKLLHQHADVRAEYEQYLTAFPHQSAYFRATDAYAHQSALVDGRKTSSDLNLYKLFLERCYRLLRTGGHCGIIIPSGIYTDLGAKGLRDLLFDKTEITSLFGLSNERFIFEEVDHRFKFTILAFGKGKSTTTFRAAFRIDPREAIRREQLTDFLTDESQHIAILVRSVRQLSPASHSVMEFAGPLDKQIAEKMAQHPALGKNVDGTWQFVLKNEFHMRNDSDLFSNAPAPNRLPLFTGKMFHQFTETDEHSGYWIEEKAGRQRLLGKEPDTGQTLDYEGYRWVHRRIARSTDTRTLITTITPPRVFTEVNSTTIKVQETGISNEEQLYLCALTNSFVLDWLIRQSVNTTLNMFYLYQLPVPRLTAADARFRPIAERAARLVCTTPAFDALARSVGLPGHAALPEAERARLRAELDGLVAHLYDLTEEEFAHVLTGFPVVAQTVKDAALEAYRALATEQQDDRDAARLVAQGEGPQVEFKSTLRQNLHTGQADPRMEEAVLKTLAAFLNTDGGTLFIGVKDDGTPLGLAADGFPNEDKLLLHLTNLVRDRMSPLAMRFLDARCVPLGGQRVLRITCPRAPEPVFVRDRQGNEAFYVRTGPATTALTHSQTLTYVRQHFASV